MLLIGFVGDVCDIGFRTNTLNPLHLRGIVGFEGAMVNLTESLATESPDDGSENKVWDTALRACDEIYAREETGKVPTLSRRP